MKSILFLILSLLLFTVCGYGGANPTPFRQLAEKYKQQNDFFVSELSRRTIRLYLKEKNPEEKVADALENIKQLNVLTFSMSEVSRVAVFIDDVEQSYSLSDYTPFKVYRNTFGNKMVFLKEKDETISDLIVVRSDMERVTLVEINGSLDLGKTLQLKDVLKIDGLDALSALEEPAPEMKIENPILPPYKKKILPHNPDGKQAPRDGFRFWLLGDKEPRPTRGGHTGNFDELLSYPGLRDRSGYDKLTIYNKSGETLLTTPGIPMVYINGYASQNDYKASLQNLNPECVQSIHVTKNNNGLTANMIEVALKGDANDAFTVCEGMLYFGQNGYIQSVMIDDDCGPGLLIDCHKKPISEIMQFHPDQVKSIELTTDPRNCEGKLQGEYVVVELK
ncbi:MAG TPA: DUF4252 domain-containing protein [Prolixibacteraceae bacterium]|nr:DUF4252 domain-containing protein [Prolixibacteraceae bacterium]